VLHDTADFVVIEKPCHLRSVPGHAIPPPSNKRKRPGSSDDGNIRRNAQEAWVLAIQSFQQEEPNDDDDDAAAQCLYRLATSERKSLESVPRKVKLFRRYIERSQKRLLVSSEEEDLEQLANNMYQRIEARQKPLLNLPEPTKQEESAVGQLILMGYGQDGRNNKNLNSSSSESLHVVHRLDCEVCWYETLRFVL
jgi:hypothetical protein